MLLEPKNQLAEGYLVLGALERVEMELPGKLF
jgi:hypothetical protein